MATTRGKAAALPATREELLTLAARAEFNGNPPAAVAQWLEEQGAG